MAERDDFTFKREIGYTFIDGDTARSTRKGY